MKKLSLELDALEVESFSTIDDANERGTVAGREASDAHYSSCCPPSASVPVACVCVSEEGEQTCDTTCNPYDCMTCNQDVTCAVDCRTEFC